MRVLVVSPAFPYPLIKGIKIRLFNILGQLARRHEVHLAVMAQPEDPEPCPELEAVCAGITRLPPPRRVWDPDHPSNYFQDAGRVLRKLFDRRPHLAYIHLTPELKEAVARLPMGDFDAVFCFRTYLFFVVAKAVARAGGGRPLLVDFDDVEHAKFAAQARLMAAGAGALLTRWESRKHREWEFAIARQSRASFVCSEIDRRRFPESSRARIHLLPNGAEFDGRLSGQPPAPVADEVPGRLLMIGDMGYFPNVDGALTFCQRILPRVQERIPEVELCIVGNHPDRDVLALAKLPGVRVTGFVPDVAPWFQSAAILVVPVRFGGGTRLKILEALRWGRAVVSTPAGCEGLDPVPGKHLVVAETDEAFADAVVELATDHSRRRALGEQGYTWARESYAWDRIGDGLLNVLERVVRAGSEGAKRLDTVIA